MMYYTVMTQANLEKEIPSSPVRSRTQDLSITCSDALPLSNRRLVGAKAIKPGSWDKLNILHTARIGMSMCCKCAIEINVMELDTGK